MNILLVAHIGGAVLMMLIALRSFWAMFKTDKVENYAKLLACGLAFEVVSGSVLAISSNANVGPFCAKIGLYFALWVLVEAILFVYANKNNFSFPTKAVSFAVAPAFASFVAALVYLS